MILASSVDLIVVVIYMVVMVGVGVILSLYNKDASDFFRSGNRMPWWLSGLSLFMASFSVYTFTGASGLAYRAPAVAFWMYFTNVLGIAFGVIILAKLWRRSRSTTVMSYLTERYSLSTNQFYSWSHLGMAVVQGGIMLLALGKFVAVAMGTDLTATIIVCGLVVAVYCIIGGLWAVAVTDALQFMVLFPCALVVLFLALYEIGGPAHLFTDAPPGFWEFKTQEFDWAYLIAYAIMMFFAMSSGSAAQRYFSVKNEKEARKVALLTMGFLLVGPIIWLIPPIVTRLANIDLASITIGLNAPQEAAYVAFCMKYLPHGAMGILLAAMLSATMSTLSANFNLYAAVITQDIIKQVFWKEATGKQLLFIGRVVTLVMGALVTIAAIIQAEVKGGVFVLMITISGVLIVPAGIPIVFGLFYRWTTWWAGLVSFCTGLVIGILYLLLGKNLSFTQQIFFAGGISAAIYFIPGLLHKARGKYRENLDSFFGKLSTPVTAEEVGDTEATDVGSFRITGWTTVGMGAAAMMLTFLDIPLAGRMVNLAISVLMISFGSFLLIACSIAQRKKRKAAARILKAEIS